MPLLCGANCTSSESYQCICMCPARELARQLAEEIVKMGKFTQIKTFLAVKDGTNRA